MLREYAHRLLSSVVEPGGRVVFGAYGSRGEPPLSIADALRSFGLRVAGRATGGDPAVTEFAWVDKQ
jgi:hypothetical protein